MSKDYKHATPKAKSGGGLLLGIFIGFTVGLATAATIAIYIFKVPVPFLHKEKQAEKPMPIAPALTESPKPDKSGVTKPRFDFYRILPGQEETITEQQLKQAEQAAAKAGMSSKSAYFLQAGAFQNPADADNLKAKLALLGLEASVEPTDLPDKGVWYRVRLGPYTSIETINRVRAQLAQDGVETSLVKIRNPATN